MKKLCWIFGGIAAVLLAGIIWFICTYTVIGGHIYNRSVTTVNLSDIDLKDPARIAQLESLQAADLRNTGLTIAEYDQIRTALPDCEIQWLVPFQGSYLDPSSTCLVLSSITEDEIAALSYFPHLQTIDMTHCSDTDAILKVIAQYPQCDVQWIIPFQGESIPYDVKSLEISALSQEDLSMIRYFTSLKSVNARNCQDLDVLLELRKQHPDLLIQWLVPIQGESYPQDTDTLEFADADVYELMAQLKYLPQLKTVTLTGTVPGNDVMYSLKQIYPDVEFSWDFVLCGVPVNSNDTEIDLSNISMKSVDEVENSLKLFNRLEKVIMYKCGISSEDMDALWKRHPETRFVWGAYFAGHYLRTDSVSFMPWKLGYTRDGRRGMNNDEAVELKYMVDLVAIDIGHNNINDLSFLYYTPNVEYLMICCSNISDLTPVGSLKKLKYLEIWENKITDISPLAGCTALEDINFTFTVVDDLTPLFGLPLKNIWFNGRYYSEEQVQSVVDAFPDSTVKYWGAWPTSLGWRRIPNYFAQRDVLEMFYLKSAGE